MELDSRKKSGRDRMMHSKSFEMQAMRGGSRKKFSGRERRAKARVRLLQARGSVELGKVASGSATQGLWLRNGKVGSQVNAIDRSQFPGRRTVRKVRRRGRLASNRAKKRVYSFRVRFG